MKRENEYTIGIDIGGTKISFGLIDRTGELHHPLISPTNSVDAEMLFESVVTGIQTVLRNSQLSLENLAGIGIGLPGKIDHKNGVAIFQNNIPWANFPIVERLKNRLALDIPIAIDNDVKVAAYAEYHELNLADDDIFTYVTISTGIANASIWRKQILRGSGFSGETGFLQIAQGENNVNLEKIVAGPAIEKAGQVAYHDSSVTSQVVFERFSAGDEKAVGIIENAAQSFALGLHAIVCILDPAHITLGGSVAYHNPSFVELIKARLATLLHEEQSHILNHMSISTIGGNNGLIGAGLLAFDQEI